MLAQPPGFLARETLVPHHTNFSITASEFITLPQNVSRPAFLSNNVYNTSYLVRAFESRIAAD